LKKEKKKRRGKKKERNERKKPHIPFLARPRYFDDHAPVTITSALLLLT